MDVDRLDALVRALSSAGSRRRALVVALGASLALSGAMLLATLSGAAAQNDPEEDFYHACCEQYDEQAERDYQMAALLDERWESGDAWGDDEDEFCASQYTNWCIPPTWVISNVNCDELRDRGSVPIYLADPADDPYGLDVWDGVGDGIGCE